MTDHWPQIVVTADAAELEALEEAFFAAGAVSVTEEDAADSPILEPAPGTTPAWPRTRLRALFPLEQPPEALEMLLVALAGRWPALEFALDRSLAERDWVRAWLAHFRPMRFGRRLWVCPAGMAVEDADAVTVKLDPGLAFGTGAHPSTAACLTWLDAHPPRGAEVLDYGCGSGILAIAALALGARHATGVDIDPQALLAARENAASNGVAEVLTVTDPEHLTGTFDVVLANILAGPLITLAPTLARLARPGAGLCLAGILTGQARAVVDAYVPWFEVGAHEIDGEWSAVSGRRRSG